MIATRPSAGREPLKRRTAKDVPPHPRYVPAEHRGKGIASALSLRALETLSARIGWRTFERIGYNGVPLTLMERRTEG
jgi:GNAT superfamily N-acetyltransferase